MCSHPTPSRCASSSTPSRSPTRGASGAPPSLRRVAAGAERAGRAARGRARRAAVRARPPARAGDARRARADRARAPRAGRGRRAGRRRARLGDPLAGTLRIGVIPTSRRTCCRGGAGARARVPAAELRWIEDKTEPLVARAGRGKLDAALLALEADLGGTSTRGDRARPLRARGAARAPARAARAPASSTPRGAQVLLLDDGHCLRDQALACARGARSEELGFRATSLPTLAQMVAAGAGVTLLPRIAVDREPARRPLGPPVRGAGPGFRTIVLAWRRSSPLDRPLRAIAAAIKKSYSPESPPARSAAKASG